MTDKERIAHLEKALREAAEALDEARWKMATKSSTTAQSWCDEAVARSAAARDAARKALGDAP